MRMVFIFLILAGCGAQPAPEFFGAVREEIRRGAHRYVLFRKETRFEIIRLGPYVPRGPQQAEQVEFMLALVEERTGCRVPPQTVVGDAGEIRGTLRCPKRR